MNGSNSRPKKRKKKNKSKSSGWVHTKNQLQSRQNTTALLRLMFFLLILSMRFPLGHIQARVWCLSIVIWVTRAFTDIDLHSGPYDVLLNSINFRKDIKSPSREFQVLGPHVLKLFSPNGNVIMTLGGERVGAGLKLMNCY